VLQAVGILEEYHLQSEEDEQIQQRVWEVRKPVYIGNILPHATAYGSVFSAVCDSVFCLFVNQISQEPLNGFVPNSRGKRVWSLARTSLNVRVKGQGYPRTKNVPPTPLTFCCMTHCNVLTANNVTQQQMGPSCNRIGHCTADSNAEFSVLHVHHTAGELAEPESVRPVCDFPVLGRCFQFPLVLWCFWFGDRTGVWPVMPIHPLVLRFLVPLTSVRQDTAPFLPAL